MGKERTFWLFFETPGVTNPITILSRSSSKSKPARALIAERAADSTAPVHIICAHVTHMTGLPAHRWNLNWFPRIAETRAAQVGINASRSSPNSKENCSSANTHKDWTQVHTRLRANSVARSRKDTNLGQHSYHVQKPRRAHVLRHVPLTGLLSKQLGYCNVSFVVLEMHAASLWLKSNRDNVSFLCDAMKIYEVIVWAPTTVKNVQYLPKTMQNSMNHESSAPSLPHGI